MCLCIYVCVEHRTSKKKSKHKELKPDMRNYEYIQVFDYSITKRPTPPPAPPNFDVIITKPWIFRTDSWFYVFRKDLLFTRGV